MSAPGVQRLGRYTLRYRIAEGGMASVYLAQQTGTADFHKWIAMKVIDPQIASTRRFVKMFLDEARLASQLDHPNLCTVFDFGEERGSWFIAMEYLHGESLGVLARTAWSTGRPPPYELVARIVADAARGLHAAHELRLPSGASAGVVHRDVSPENIFVTYAGPTKVVDFGVACWKEQTPERTGAGELQGKIAYMSPEQLREQSIDRRADLWSLGVVLWEVTVGRRLFRRKTDAATIDAVLGERVPHPSRFRPDYPDELAAIVNRALERDRGRRYQTALELARALERWLATTGHPGGTGEVGDFMQALFAAQIAVREPLLRATRADMPLQEISEVWHAPPAARPSSDSPPDDARASEVPDARPATAVDRSEEVTVLRPYRSSARSLPPTSFVPAATSSGSVAPSRVASLFEHSAPTTPPPPAPAPRHWRSGAPPRSSLPAWR
ncbi:MAG: Serine/threonine protein kinase PrkC, regulator of stationary phase, partial [Myxococcaceae bacterium]|nr:Serine/threonine protein kinase PrkC, regulator of stationary phase [Myxococcaceae bacterium]